MTNQILAALPGEDLLRLKLNTVEIAEGARLFDSKSPADKVYFPDEGVIGIGIEISGNSIATSLVGPEGLVGAFESAPNSYGVALSPLKVRRLTIGHFQTVLSAHSNLQAVLNAYCRRELIQMQANAACNGLHDVPSRVARLLLRLSTILNSDTFAMTHDRMAALLGVTRSTVTLELMALRELQSVSYVRGKMIIRDKKRLQSMSCKCPL
jgi:CRP-like cAMP-binding protein